eukprot:5015833-Pleurochrysis_carterae.AAC.2
MPVFRITTSDSRAINVEIDLRFSGDFQIIKALISMSPYTSGIWCECEGACLRAFCAEPLSSWAAVRARWAQGGEAPCKVKVLRRVCELNGYSYEELMGLPFKLFGCGKEGCGAPHF